MPGFQTRTWASQLTSQQERLGVLAEPVNSRAKEGPLVIVNLLTAIYLILYAINGLAFPIPQSPQTPQAGASALPGNKQISDDRLAIRRGHFVSLITSSVAQASGLDRGSRAMILMAAAEGIQQVDAPTAERYLLSAYRQSETIPLLDPDNLRSVIQGNVVSDLASIDPDCALRLLEDMDKPRWTASPHEDFRNQFAPDIVRALLARNAPGDRDKVRAALRFMGETGQYSYAGAAELISALAGDDNQLLRSRIFSEARTYFDNEQGRDEKFSSTPQQFADLIASSAHHEPASMIGGAIWDVIESTMTLESTGSEKDAGEPAPGTRHLRSPTGSELAFHRLSTYIGFELYPVACLVDPGLASRILEGDPDLKMAIGNQSPKDVEDWLKGHNFFVGGVETAARMQDINQTIRRREEVTRALELAPSQPDQAVTLAEQIELPSFRVQALAGVAAQLPPRRARTLLVEAEAAVSEVADDEDKARALISVARAWATTGDAQAASRSVAQAFAIATRLYDNSVRVAPGARPLLRPSLGLLVTACGLEATLNSSQAVKMASSLSDPAVRGLTTVMIARYGLSDLQRLSNETANGTNHP